jgi:hypothetical protein
MHYRNGREAFNGDKIVSLEGAEIVKFGTLQDAVPGNDYCNGIIVDDEGRQVGIACMCDCLHIEDLGRFIAAAGWDRRPPGK